MWAKFGQMAGKAISKIKKPKGLKAKAMGMVKSAKSKSKNFVKNQYQFIKDYPGLSAATIGTGAVIGGSVGYGINKMKKKKKNGI